MIVRKAAVAALVVVAAAPFAASAQLSSYATETMSGQRLVAPPGAMEVHVSRDQVPAGTTIAVHMHFWPRYVLVESGEVQVTLLDGGPMETFTAGETIVEPLEKWHSGLVTKDAVLVAVEQTPPGGCNTIHPPAPAQPAVAARPAANGKPAVPARPAVPAMSNDRCPRP
ncbi:MAG TPA: hypothetical protein VGB57_09045 [Allosphingosinicella sp.]|jgi:quercetin dioxygenase-like cupin family protein